MGGSGKWLKSLIFLKKLPTTVNEKQDGFEKGKKKWRLWRSSSEGSIPNSTKGLKRPSDYDHDYAFTAAMATVARAQPRDFMVVKQEWAAIRIQTAFRGLLARRALRALKAVVRLQAIFRGRQVRKQAAVTLKCMQALVRVQARVKARSVGMSSESYANQKSLDQYLKLQADPIKQAELGWCDSPGTMDEVRAKLHKKQQGAMKREKAIAYSNFQQQSRSCASPARRVNKASMSLKHQALDGSSPGWSWLDRWMARKPWENRLMEKVHTDSPETTFARKSEDNIASSYSYSSKHDSVKVRKNNVTTKVAAKPPVACNITRSSSAPSCDSLYDESSVSTSSTSVSPIPMSTSTLPVDREEDGYGLKPSYMNLTESTKAKQRSCRCSPLHNMRRYIMEDQFPTKSMALSNGDAKSTAGSNPSFNLYRDLYPPLPVGRHDETRNRRC